MKFYRLFLYTALTAILTIVSYFFGVYSSYDMTYAIGYSTAKNDAMMRCERGQVLFRQQGAAYWCSKVKKL